MPLVTFPIRTGSAVTKVVGAERSQDGVASLFYNNPIESSPANIGGVSQNIDTIDLNQWNDLRNRINSERERRNRTTFSFSSIDNDTKIDDSHFQQLKTALIESSASFTNDALNGKLVSSDQAYSTNQDINDTDGGASQPGITTFTAPGAPVTPDDVSQGETILASSINGIIKSINDASGVCVCNCNYCTCNCNYCTCNCNYSCTCNCNYSDRRLKTNIVFSHKFGGLTVYEFSYKWNTKKRYLGIMAQDLIGTKYENALIKNKLGVYMVDYSKLPIEMEEV
jgi:hypothetical protein